MSNISTPVSDLFFNFDIVGLKNVSGEEYRELVGDNAKAFASLIEDAFNVNIAPADLVEDFFERL